MIVRRRDISWELRDIVNAKTSDIPSHFIEQLRSHLKKEGDLTLKSNLTDVINTRYFNRSEEARESFEATIDNQENRETEELTDEELIKMIFDDREKEQDPNFAVIRNAEDEINELLFKYARQIAPRSFYLPLEEWDVAALSFYCILWDFDADVEALLFAIFQFSKEKRNPSFDFETYTDLVDQIEKGYNDAKTVLELILNARLEGNQTGQNQHPLKASDDKSKKITHESVRNDEKYFEINATYNKLKAFRTELEYLGYIDKTLSADSFRRVFLFEDDPLKDKLKQQPGKPIEWLIHKSHLGYLIKLLSQNNIITDKEYYKIAENCFLFDGEPIANTVFHKMQLPAIPARRKIGKIVDTLK